MGSIGRRTVTASLLAAAAWASCPGAGSLAAQTMDPRPPATNLTWWHPLAAAGGVATLFLIDEPVRDWIQDHKGSTRDDVADFAKDFKDPKVIAVSSIGAVALGLMVQEPKVTVTGLQIAAAYGLAGGLNYVTKWTFGRSRPSGTPDDPTNFDFFDGDENSAFPSGSAAVVFSLATTLADAIDRKPVTILLYTGAAVNAWARMYSDRHWLSDVTLGALIGITSAKLVNGEWTVFGLRPPMLWTDGRSMGMGYRLSVR
jgi:membrane-associated phospholipid phosphatase